MRLLKILSVVTIALAIAIIAVSAEAQLCPSLYGMGCGFGYPAAVGTCGTGVGYTVQNTVSAQSCFSTAGGWGLGVPFAYGCGMPYAYGCGYPAVYGCGLGACGLGFDCGLSTCGLGTCGLGTCGFPTAFC